MGLLDDLKSEAERLQNQKSSEEKQKARLEAIYREEINPKMQKITTYLGELSEQLNILKPETQPVYTIPGYGKVKGLIQKDYSVNADSINNMTQLCFRFYAELPKEIEFSVTPKSKANETCSFLEEQNLTFSEWPVRDLHQRPIGITFQVKLRVEILFLFQADIENSCIQLTIVNFEDFTESNKSYRPKSIDIDWLEDMGYYILRKNESMHTLEISEEKKLQLREQLKQEEAIRQREMEELLVREEAEREQKENRFVKILKNTIKGSQKGNSKPQ